MIQFSLGVFIGVVITLFAEMVVFVWYEERKDGK